MELTQVMKNIIAALIMAAALYLSYHLILTRFGSNAIATLSSVLIGAIIYIIVLIAVKGLLEDDLAAVPVIGKITIRGLRKLGVFKEISQEL